MSRNYQSPFQTNQSSRPTRRYFLEALHVVFSLLLFLGALSLLVSCQEYQEKADSSDSSTLFERDQEVIYGQDDRRDLYQVKDARQLALADSTVAIVRSHKLNEVNAEITSIRGVNFGQQLNLCPSEPFRDQDTSSFCTGFLVAKNIIVTAGHCVAKADSCATIKFVFGFGLKNTSDNPNDVLTKDVYACQQIIYQQIDKRGADFAVIRLDREVLDHPPVKLKSSGDLDSGDSLFMIGHPYGLPAKFSSGKVRNPAGFLKKVFKTNIDSYSGNSGSPVFEKASGKVVGLLVRGDKDFKLKGGCRSSHKCDEDGCGGEDATDIRAVIPFIPFEY